MKTSLRLITLILSCVALSHADTTFTITYVTTGGTECPFGSVLCLPVGVLPGSLPAPFSATFSLSDAQLGVNGTYDISSSLDQFSDRHLGIVPFSSISLTAEATVAGGYVSNINVAFHDIDFEVVTGGFTEDQYSFNASGGTWASSDDQGFGDFTDPKFSYNGTYTISPQPPAVTPEPATLAMLGIGMLGLAGRFRRRS